MRRIDGVRLLGVMAWLGTTVALAGPQNIEAGPIWNREHAAERCPQVCASLGGWTGEWWTTVQGEMSVCQCAGAAPTGEARKEQVVAPTDAGIPPVPESSGELVAIVWGGGKDTTAAYESLAQWDAEKRLLGDLVRFAPGFPKIVSSATVPGLNPGFEIVLLGVCPRDEGRDERAYIKALHPFTYEKPVKGVQAACPIWVEQKSKAVNLQRTVKGKGLTLSVVELAWPEEPEASDLSFTSVPVRWLSVVARDGAGALLGVYSKKDEYSLAGSRAVGCRTEVKSASKDTVVLERTCKGSSGACDTDPGERWRVTVRWNGKAFIPEEKLLAKWEAKNCAE
ncbi:hypothetical protein F0U59_31415 [Archangium gephyra]|nr:hypothetical protein F0U59_31415 [Archangium gephyra]